MYFFIISLFLYFFIRIFISIFWCPSAINFGTVWYQHYAGLTLSRSWSSMDTQIRKCSASGRSCGNLNAGLTLSRNWSPMDTRMPLRKLLRECFGMPKISRRSFQKDIFACPSGITFGTVWRHRQYASYLHQVRQCDTSFTIASRSLSGPVTC